MNHPPYAASVLLRLTACLFYTAIVVCFSLFPSSSFDTPDIPYLDKLAHFGMYGMYAAMLVWTMQARADFNAKFKTAGLAIVIYCSVFGAVMEFLQEVAQPGDRQYSFGDMAANALGAVTLYAVVCLLPAQSGIAARQTLADADTSV